jgi:uncharacterized protein DUF6355
MSAFTRRVATAAAGLVTTATAMLAVAGTAHAAVVRPQDSPPCGYYHYNDQVSWYNHCRNNFDEIKVEHFFGHDTFFCAHPGVQQVPMGDNSWGIVRAEYDGQDCPPYRY